MSHFAHIRVYNPTTGLHYHESDISSLEYRATILETFKNTTVPSTYLALNGSNGPLTGNVDMGAFLISSTTDPTTNDMLSRKAYVDNYSYDKLSSDSRYLNITNIGNAVINLNNYTDTGEFYIEADPENITNRPTDMPTGWGFILKVVNHNTYAGTYITQHVIYESTLYTRIYISSWDIWSHSPALFTGGILTTTLTFNVTPGTDIIDFGDSMRMYESSAKVWEMSFLHASTVWKIENVGHEVILKVEDSQITLTKPLEMSDNFISGVKLATANDHAASKLYVDTHVSTSSVGIGDAILVTEVEGLASSTGVHLYNTSADNPKVELMTGTGDLSSLIFTNLTQSRYASLLFIESTGSLYFGNQGGTVMEINTSGLTMSDPIAMGSNKITGLTDGTVSGDAMNYGQITSLYGACVLLDGSSDMTGYLSILPAGADGTRLLLFGSGISSNDAKLSVNTSGAVLNINAQSGVELSIAGTNIMSVSSGLMYLSKAIHMGSQKITNMADGTSSADAVSKSQLDGHSHSSYVPYSGGTQTLDMRSSPSPQIRFNYYSSSEAYNPSIGSSSSELYLNGYTNLYLRILGSNKITLSSSAVTLASTLTMGGNTITEPSTIDFRNTHESKLLLYSTDFKIGTESNTIYQNTSTSGTHRLRCGMGDRFTVWNTGANFSVQLAMNSNKITSVGTGTNTSDGVNKGQMDTAIGVKYTDGNKLTVTQVDSGEYSSTTTGIHLYNYGTGWPMIHNVVGTSQYSNIRMANAAASRYFGMYFTESTGIGLIYNSGGTIITCGATYCYIHKPLYVYNQAITGLGSSASTSAAMRKDYIDNADSLKLNKTGGTMGGQISMNYNKITYLGNGTSTYDAANFGQLSAKVTKSGDTMTGPLSMSYQRITTMGSGTSYYDACNKGQMDTAVATKANTSHTHNYMPLTTVTGGTNDCNNYRTTGMYTIYTSGAAWTNRPSGASTWWENFLTVRMCGGTTFGVQEWDSPGTRTSYRRYYYATNNWSAWVAI